MSYSDCVALGVAVVWGVLVLVEAVRMAKKRKKAKKAKQEAVETEQLKTEVVNELAKIPQEVLVPLNELELIKILDGVAVELNAPGLRIQVKYCKHPGATPAGLARFWGDVERLAVTQRKNLIASAPVLDALSRDIDMSLEQAQHDREDRTGVALRSSPEAVQAVQTGSFIPPFAAKIAADLKKQHEQQQAKTPEERRLGLAAPAAQLALENKGGADGKGQ